MERGAYVRFSLTTKCQQISNGRMARAEVFQEARRVVCSCLRDSITCSLEHASPACSCPCFETSLEQRLHAPSGHYLIPLLPRARSRSRSLTTPRCFAIHDSGRNRQSSGSSTSSPIEGCGLLPEKRTQNHSILALEDTSRLLLLVAHGSHQ